MSGCGLLGSTTDVTTPSNAQERRLELTLGDWLGAVASRPAGSDSLGEMLTTRELRFAEVEGVLEGVGSLDAWLSRLRSPLPRVAYEISGFHLDATGDDPYHAHFELVRRGVDEAGVPHITRSEHAWMIQQRSGGPHVVVAIEERPILALPGTGPGIVCY